MLVLFGREMVNRLVHFFEFQGLTDAQHGYTQDRSTSVATVRIVEEITQILGKKEKMNVIGCDLRKSYDIATHKALLRKKKLLRRLKSDFSSSHI